MRFAALDLAGAFLVAPEPIFDERGCFARVVCKDEFAKAGLIGDFAQSSISFNERAGTVRGMHYSTGPHAETKLVRCTAGAIQDVLIDVRPSSPSFGRVTSVELTAANRLALYIPCGVAHGFQTLADATEVLYAIDHPYVADAAAGMRWDDPFARVSWRLPVSVISERDRTYPDLIPRRE